ncbi:MAG: sulfatase, partial [Verrucomicrobia bacterium]|nr:sulfatase [Verrucomicrobiota bacterium]
RSGDWKLLGNPNDTSHQAKLTDADQRFLVNLADDRGEKTNLAADYPTKVNQLEALYQSWKKTAANQ